MNDLHAVKEAMRHCHVRRKEDLSVCFDLYADQDGRHLLSCSAEKTLKGRFLLSTIEDSHKLSFEQLCLSAATDRRIKAVLDRDWLTELAFSLIDREGCKICDIV